MSNVAVTFHLPEDVVERARDAGLLSDERVREMMLAELARIERFFNLADRLAEMEPRLTPEEIEAEIRAARDVG